jgi:hypothetical protein
VKAFWLAVLLPPLITVAITGVVREMAQRWQGAWVVRGADYAGSVQAWNVHGDSVTVYDAASHQTTEQRLTFQSPCRLVRGQSAGGGDSVSTTNTFAFGPNGLHVAPAQAAGGARAGGLLIACIGNDVYTLDAQSGRCQRWNATMSEGPTPAEECVYDASPPGFVLRRLGGPEDVRLGISGDALLSPELASQLAERQPSFQAAVKRADALLVQ